MLFADGLEICVVTCEGCERVLILNVPKSVFALRSVEGALVIVCDSVQYEIRGVTLEGKRVVNRFKKEVMMSLCE